MAGAFADLGIRILIAQEDSIAANKLSDFLLQQGIHVRYARAGGAAKDILRTWRPHFILIDLFLPETNALSFLKHMKQADQLGENKTRVFVTSATANPNNVKECFRWGASDFLLTPLKYAEVLQRLALYVQRRRELSEYSNEDLAKLHESEYFLYLTDLTLREALKSQPIHQSLHNLMNMIAMVFKAVRASVVECHLETRQGIVHASSDDENITDHKIDLRRYPEMVYALSSGKILSLDNIKKDATMFSVAKMSKSIRFNSVLVAPVPTHDGWWGVVSVRMPEDAKPVKDLEIRFAQLVANVIGLAIAQNLGETLLAGDSDTIIKPAA